MMRRLLLIVMMTAWVAGCGNKVPPVAKLASTDVVLAFGDSLTYGTGAKAEDSYPVVLGQLIGRTVVRSGVPGEVTARRLLGLIGGREVDVAVRKVDGRALKPPRRFGRQPVGARQELVDAAHALRSGMKRPSKAGRPL